MIKREIMDIQVEKEHYDFTSYTTLERWCSYYQQIVEILECGKKEVVLIGVGDGMIEYIVSKIDPTIKFITVDFDKNLSPDVCCDILQLSKFMNKKVDVVVCCQVLEHLPHDDFQRALKEICSVLKDDGTLILSLPDGGFDVGLNMKIPKIPMIGRFGRICRFYRKEFSFDGEHYWEINGARKYSLRKIRKEITSVFFIQKSYSVKYNFYHKFFVCTKQVNHAIREK